jgi:hypothetical protein
MEELNPTPEEVKKSVMEMVREFEMGVLRVEV